MTSGDRPAGDFTDADVRTFLIADVRGYTRYTHERGDEAAAELAANFARIARRAIEERGGTLLELRGDEALGVFTSSREALRAAVDLQALVRGSADDQNALPLGVGIGLDAGEAVAVEGGYRGGALNLAARLCSLAAPGETLASETVVVLARRVDGIHYEERGAQRFKGLESAVRVVEVIGETTLAGSPARGRTRWRRFRRRYLTRPRVAVAAVLAVLAAVAIGAIVVRSTGDQAAAESAGALVLDPASGDERASVPLGTSPSAVTVGEGSVWVLDADDKTVSQIDPESYELERTFSTSSTPTDIAAGAGALWVGNAQADPNEENVSPASVSRLDPFSGTITKTFQLPPAPPGLVSGLPPGATTQRIAASPEAVWVVNPDQTVSRIDPRSNRIVATVRDVRARTVAVGDGDVWVTESGGLAEIDSSNNTVARRVAIEADLDGGLAVGGGAVWTSDPLEGNVWRVETGSERKPTAIPVDTWVAGLAFGEGAAWATNEIADTAYRLDPRTGEPERIEGIDSPRAVAAGDGGVWVTTAEPPSRDTALPSSVCSDLYFDGRGSPDVLIVSDLTLRGFAAESTQSMVAAVRLVLERRGFEAGAFSVGYQSCDNSTAQTGSFDFFRCGSNAKAYARNLRVVAVFGSYSSPCSFIQIPIANEAQEGPLAMVSPSNTFDGLTSEADLYPAGTRSYFRLASPYGYQGSAQVTLAKQLGANRLYLLDDGNEPEYVDDLLATADRLNVDIVGRKTIDPEASSYPGVAKQVASTRPESVAFTGFLTPGWGGLLRELRAELGPSVPITAPDGFELADDLVALAGPAANGFYVASYGIVNDLLPPAGKQFLRAFAASNGGDPGPDLSASFGGQGAEILLDAIARSDGTRESVTEELHAARVENGILGDVSWDPVGELVEGAITFRRMKNGELVPDRVVRVRPPRAAP